MCNPLLVSEDGLVAMHVVLIGYRGTGKTTVGQLLADRLGNTFTDSDVEIERAAGKTIVEIFAEEGEPGFRDRETVALTRLLADSDGVLALGGGAVLREENRQAIQAADAQVVWLTAKPETIAARMGQDATTATRRPNLTPTGGLSEISELLGRRNPIYRQCCDYQVDTEGKTSAAVVEAILNALRPPSDS